MRNITLYNEIKALVHEAQEAEANAQAWKKFAKDALSEARTLTNTAKKLKANQGIEFTFQSLLDYIHADLAEEAQTKSTEDTDLTDYRPGDFPASENNSDEEIRVSPVQRVEPNDPDAYEEEPYESANL